jgi:uncharacterized protein (TIGR00369 family)
MDQPTVSRGFFATEPDENAPTGYRRLALVDPFEEFVGPFYGRIEEAPADGDRRALLWIAFEVEARHTNAYGFVHGGMMLTLADMAMGASVTNALGGRQIASMQLQSQFLKGPRTGDIVEGRTEISRETRSIVFTRSQFEVRGEPVLSASAVFKIIGE